MSIYLVTGLSEWHFSAIYSYIPVSKICCTAPETGQVYLASTPQYHAVDQHDTPPSYLILTPGQPVLL